LIIYRCGYTFVSEALVILLVAETSSFQQQTAKCKKAAISLY